MRYLGNTRTGNLFFASIVVFTSVVLILVSIGVISEAKNVSLLPVVTYLLNGMLSGVLFAKNLTKRPISCATLLWYFVFLFMCLIPFTQYTTGVWKWADGTEFFGDNLIVYCNLVVFVAYTTAYITYSIGLRKTVRSTHENSFLARKQYAIHLVGVVFTLLILVVLLFIYLSVFGLDGLAFRWQRHDIFMESEGVSGIVAIGDSVVRPGITFLTLAVFLLASKEQVKENALTPIMILLPVAFLLVNFPTGVTRMYLLSLVFVALCMWSTNIKTQRAILSFVLIGGVYLSAILDKLRYGFVELKTLFSFDISYFYAGHLNSYETILMNIEWVLRDGITWGSELLGAILFWVPRSLWTSKPISASHHFSGEFLNREFGAISDNVGVSTLGTFYHSFGFTGALIFGVFIGFVAAFIDGRMNEGNIGEFPLKKRAKYNFAGVTLYPMLLGAFFILLRGQFQVGLRLFIGYTIAFILIRTFAVRRRR